MRILSIDWDYFINATCNQRTYLFPDGGNENIGEYLSNIIWQTRYVQANSMGDERIENIGIREDAYNMIFRTFKQSPCYICCDSHKELGNFILNMMSNNSNAKNDVLEITNIDHHSDCYDIGEELNCGNWVNKVFEKCPDAKLVWVGNEDSSFDIPDSMKDCDIKTTTLLDCLSERYDVVFLCRSGIWSPPHLDKWFRKLDRFLSKRCNESSLKEPMIDRWPAIQNDLDVNIAHYKSVMENLKERL